MSGSELSRRLYLPSLAAELPMDWLVSEGATFTSPSGADIHLRLNRAREGSDSSQLAEQMEAAAHTELNNVEAVVASTIPMSGGRVAHERRFTSERDGVPSISRIVCLVDGGLALTVSASWPVGGESVEAQMDDALASIRLLSQPVTNRRVTSDPAPSPAPERRPALDVSVWSELRGAWSKPQPDEADVVRASRWSPEELAVCAAIVGAASFPTVGSALLASLPDVGLKLVLDTVTRSFVARGLVRSGESGRAVLSDEFRNAIEVAVYPDLSILVERLGEPGNGRWWFGLRPDRAAQVTVLADGSRECSEIDPGLVVPRLLALTGTDVAGSTTVTDPRRVTLPEIGDGTGCVAALVRVNTAWRVDETIRGGVFTWAVGVDGSLWLAEPDAAEATPAWNLQPTDVVGIRGVLLDHLPGS